MMNAAAPPAPRKATGASRQPPIPCSPCSIFHECLEMGTAAAPRRLDFGGIEIGNQGVPPEFNLRPAAAVFKPHTASPSGDIVGGWFQSVDDFCGCADEAGDIHITEDELSPMTRASLCDLVD